jgi:hypothetical protein
MTIPFERVKGECYWIGNDLAKLEQHRRMVRDREKLARQFRKVSEKQCKQPNPN